MIDFTCVVEGGDRYEVKATARDILIWEKTGAKRSFTELMQTLPLADLYWIAHLASKRKGLFEGNLNQFEQTVDLEFGVADGPDPEPDVCAAGVAVRDPAERVGARRGSGDRDRGAAAERGHGQRGRGRRGRGLRWPAAVGSG
jgi:hypothetical protein